MTDVDNSRPLEEINPIAEGFKAAINELCDRKNKQTYVMPEEELIYKMESKKNI